MNSDLPLEIFPLILEQLATSRPKYLLSSCLVSKTFYALTVPYLYQRISIYPWLRGGKNKVVQVFETLAARPDLAKYVHRLEIRDFPHAHSLLKEKHIWPAVLAGLQNCVNLQACTWTRDGSLNDAVLRSLQQSCMRLRSFTFNGRNEGGYTATLLQEMRTLREISVIMASPPVIDVLPSWINSLSGLRSLTLICKESPRVTDSFLESIAAGCGQLEHLQLVGCTKVTHRGVLSVISASVMGLRELAFEGVTPGFGLATLAERCCSNKVLRRLRTISLTLDLQRELKDTVDNVVALVSGAPIEHFQVYSVGSVVEASWSQTFWERIMDRHAERLTRFSVHRMLIGLDVIADMCRRCEKLEKLFVVIEPEHLDGIAQVLTSARKLRAVHISFPREANTDAPPMLSVEKALSIVNCCSSTLSIFGCNTRVWQVERVVETHGDGHVEVRRLLSQYDSPDIPEQFLVVFT